jgi:hypothetical protein
MVLLQAAPQKGRLLHGIGPSFRQSPEASPLEQQFKPHF